MEELYEEVFKSQKASYLLLRKHFTEIEKQIGEARKEVKAPKDEIISNPEGDREDHDQPQ